MSKYYSVFFMFGRFHIIVNWMFNETTISKSQTIFSSEDENQVKYFLANS